MNVAHRKFAISPLPTGCIGVIDTGDHCVSTRQVLFKFCNESMGIDPEFRLGSPSYTDTCVEMVERTLKM